MHPVFSGMMAIMAWIVAYVLALFGCAFFDNMLSVIGGIICIALSAGVVYMIGKGKKITRIPNLGWAAFIVIAIVIMQNAPTQNAQPENASSSPAQSRAFKEFFKQSIDGGTTYYIDENSIVKNGDSIRVDVLANHNKPINGAASTIDSYTLVCNQGTFKVEWTGNLWFDRPDGKGAPRKIDDFKPVTTDVAPIRSGYLFGELAMHLCK